jgi:hypothetical protein
MVTGVVGVPIHELSHATFALIFGHKIKSIKLFQKPDENEVMGYVQHSYNQGSIYQQAGNFFIKGYVLFLYLQNKEIVDDGSFLNYYLNVPKGKFIVVIT